MSLLIDALKQAEAAQRHAEKPAVEPTLKLEPRSVETPTPPVTPAPPSRPAPAAPQRQVPREAVRELFEVKHPGPSQTPIFLAVFGIACLIAGGAYLWWATQPRGGLQPGPALAAPTSQRAPIPPAQQASAQTVPTPPPQPDQPPRAATASKPSAPTRAPQEVAQQDDADRPVIRRSTPHLAERAPVAPLQQALAAYAAGSLEQARLLLQPVLRAEPRNLDALNAMAMIALRTGRQDDAVHYYQQALAIDPKDANARAQLALLYGERDPVSAESRLHQVLAEHPESATALFALGSLYARQNRWSEAQQAFFQAHTLDAANADTLYNLAVSLDHLNQPSLAHQYYEEAIRAAGPNQVAFDLARARQRAAALQERASAAGTPPP